jgi:hypothetical protein
MRMNVNGNQVLVVHKYFQKFGKTLCLMLSHGKTL